MKEILKDREFWAAVVAFTLLIAGGYIAVVAGYMVGIR